MGWYKRNLLPRVLCWACSAPAIMEVRQRLIPLASGRMLELGVGGGLNLPFYRPDALSGLYGLDPSRELRMQAERAAAALGLPLQAHAGVAESLPFIDGTFDTVVCTFTLCSVRSPVATMAEVRRVLRPGGRMLFAEHGLAPEPKVARWQRRLEPLWGRLAGGCHLARNALCTIEAAGLAPLDVTERYLAGVPRFAGWCSAGIARSPSG